MDRIYEVINEAKDAAIHIDTFRYRIEKLVGDLRFGSTLSNYVLQENDTLKISLCSLKYPDAERFKIIYKHVPDTNECVVQKFDHYNEYGFGHSYTSLPKVVTVETAQLLLTYADALEWHFIESVLGEEDKMER